MAEAIHSTPSASPSSTASYGYSGQRSSSSTGLHFDRMFSKPGLSPYSEVLWERRTASITDASGKIIFEQKDVEVPADWSITATNIVASKYLHGHVGISQGEAGARETGGGATGSRVGETSFAWGFGGGA